MTKVCPVGPVAPGQMLVFSGSVSNTGNITLQNIVVVNNQPAANTPVFTQALLAPGAVANFTGSYLAPTNCSVSDTLSASASSVCGVAVASTVSATCPIVTTPQIAVTAICPATPILPGGSLVYSGTVRNTGDNTLTGVVVVSDRPVANTTVFTVGTLAPGASANFTASYTVPANSCTVTTTFSGIGKDSCTLNAVTNSVATTCTVATAPAIGVTLVCPIAPVASGGLITYSGTVRNSGNVTLNNVVVMDTQVTPNAAVIGPITLAPGASANFTANFTAPLDACAVSSTVTATGNDNCTAALVSNSASATCTLITAPSILVTQACPVSPAVPGGLLTYNGTVSNTGNSTLTNVVVLNNLSGATPVFTAATLAPGAVANFTGSYLAPINCASTSTSTATGRSICGVAVTSTVSATCPVQTSPAIVVTQTCPSTSVLPGGILNYSGTVFNAGNITLTNLVVLDNRPAADTVVFTQATLAPGATANFTGSYQVPTNCCVISSTIRARGQGCDGATVSDTATRTCTVLTSPKIVVTKVCAPGILRPGDLLTYSGTVSNAGNITLLNVTVRNNQSPNSPPALGPIILAPNQSVSYNASYVIPPDFCGLDTVTATGNDDCTAALVSNSVTTTCAVLTAPRIILTQNCPLLPTPRGGLFTFTGSVSNPGNVTLINVFVVDNQPTNQMPVIGPITLAPGASVNFSGSYTAPRCCCSILDTLTARGQDACSGSNVTTTASAICPYLLTPPSIAVVQYCPPNPIPMGSVYNFSGYVTNISDVTLTNVYVFGPQGTNAPVLGPIQLAPGESEVYFGSYTVPFDTCAVSVMASGQDVCGGRVATATAGCPVATTTLLTLTQYCPVAPVSPGGLLTYSGSVSNAGNISLTNVVVLNDLSGTTPVFASARLAPGATATFTGSYLAPTNCFTTSTSTATGESICGIAVTNTVSTTCLITTTPQIAVAAVCPPTPVVPGGPVTYNGTVRNTGDIPLTNVVVFSDRPVANTTVFTVDVLAPGASANFTGAYTVPLNACTVTTTFSGTGKDICTPATVTNIISTTCTVTTAPRLGVTLSCPAASSRPGNPVTYTGTVRNLGNVTLNNVVVVNNQPAPNTLVIGPLTLLPGASADFTANFTAPSDACSVSSTVTATGRDNCTAILLTNSVSAACPLITTPRILVTQLCPASPTTPGGLLTYSGLVKNAGNITLTNVVVRNNLSGATPVFTAATLAPGAASTFTGSYVVPLNVCSVVATLSVTANDICAGNGVTNTATATCPVATTPGVSITQNCQANPVSPGSLLTYNGSVRNVGNITLTNLVVTNDRSGTTPIVIIASLAPGAFATYIGTYTAPSDACSVSSTVTAVGNEICAGGLVTNSASATCTLLATPRIVVSQVCPVSPPIPGGLLTYSGTLRNTGNIT
ncbi:MAG: DUF7507 domain-containing protein, partial [Terriglobales bacterium]